MTTSVRRFVKEIGLYKLNSLQTAPTRDSILQLSDTLKEAATRSTDMAEALAAPPEEPARRDRPMPSSLLKEKRGDRSQLEISQAAEISQGFLSELENGQKRLTPDVAQRLARALGATADELLLS